MSNVVNAPQGAPGKKPPAPSVRPSRRWRHIAVDNWSSEQFDTDFSHLASENRGIEAPKQSARVFHSTRCSSRRTEPASGERNAHAQVNRSVPRVRRRDRDCGD
jgi:hypothetical protein